MVTPLFHPRTDRWDDHFRRDGARIDGKTPTGRTSVWLFEISSGAQFAELVDEAMSPEEVNDFIGWLRVESIAPRSKLSSETAMHLAE